MIKKTFCKAIKCHLSEDWHIVKKDEEIRCKSNAGFFGVCDYLHLNGAIGSSIWELGDEPYYRSDIAILAALVKAKKVAVNDK